MASAFAWGLLLTALLVPWDQLFIGVTVPGVLFNRRELARWTAEVAWGATNVAWTDLVLYYARFAGYPVLALLLWATIQGKFCRARRQMTVDIKKPA